jgi:hypothetical protein
VRCHACGSPLPLIESVFWNIVQSYAVSQLSLFSNETRHLDAIGISHAKAYNSLLCWHVQMFVQCGTF